MFARIYSVVFAISLALFLEAPLSAQLGRATLSGFVSDPSGAPVANAKVRVTDVARSEVGQRTTNDAGRFVVNNLVPGTYKVDVEAPGFSSKSLTNITLSVDQQLDLEIPLTLGTTQQTLEVSAAAAPLDTENATISQVVDHSQIANLPLNGRQSLGLITLVPNVRPGPTFDPTNFDGAGTFSINGGRNNSNELLLDGSPSTAAGSGPGSAQTAAYKLGLDAVQEFRVLTNTLPPEYGNTGGGAVSVISKSGTNSFHGSAFDYLRNSALDANGFFSNRSGIPLASFKRNQFGGSFGGPVILPKLYNGRNKTFFFVDYEGLRSGTGANLVRTVPTAAYREGDFSTAVDSAGRRVTIYDPQSTVQLANGKYSRTPFLGNRIPASRFDLVSRNLLQYWPEPNQPGVSNNFVVGTTSIYNSNQADYRLDHRINERHSFYARYSHNFNISQPALAFGFSDPAFTRHWPTRQAVGDYTWVKSNLTVINAHYGYSWLGDANSRLNDGFDIGTLGFSPNFTKDIQHPALSQINITNISQIGSGIFFVSPYSIHQFAGSVSHVSGNHTIKFGADVRRYRYVGTTYNLPGGSFTFGPNYTQGPDPLTATSTGGIGFASFLLGAGSGQAMIQNSRDIRALAIAGYIQDDWKVSPRLTLNFGMRYDLFPPRTEAQNQLSWFDQTAANPLSSQTGLNLHGGLQFASPDHPRQFKTDWNNFAPRIGLAYQADSKTVIRSGFGVMYPIPNTSITAGAGFDGFSATSTFVSSLNGLVPTSYLSQAFSGGLVQPTGAANGLLTLVGQSIAPKDPSNTSSYNLQWNFAIERELPGHGLVEVSYLGNHGVHLPIGSGIQMNQLTTNDLTLGSALLDRVPNPFYNVISTGILSGATTTRGQLLRPYPQFDTVTNDQPSLAQSIYHAMGIRFEKRLRTDYVVQASYTFAKLIDDSSESAGFTGTQQGPQDSHNFKAERSLASQDMRHRFVASFQAPLPFGRKRAFFSSTNRFTEALIGGWQINGIFSSESGIPLGLTAQNTSNSLGGGERPNSTGHSALLSGPIQDRLNRFFDVSQFTQPAPFTFGNLSRTLPDVRGPRSTNLDVSLFKNFNLTEAVRMQLRGEAFNITNSPMFSLPGTVLGTANFGVITSQSNSPRQIQVALRLDF
ncbi:MAG TPA: TonB-dependent receptor [Bryobacteraceae bacterium]